MRVFKGFIFCLLILSWLMPTVLLATSKSVTLYLEIAKLDSDVLFNQEILAKISQMIAQGELTNKLNSPVVIDQVAVEDVTVTATVSGGLEATVVISVF